MMIFVCIGGLQQPSICMPCAVYATANVSGGHVNPAVTFANCLTGHMSWARGGLYMLAQLLGGIFGALLEVREQLHVAHF